MTKLFLPETDLNFGIKVHEQYSKTWRLAIDVGANNGYYSNLYCKKFFNVVGFEPNKSLKDYHTNLKSLHENYQYYELGLYDKNDEVEYYSVVNGPGLSTLKFDYIQRIVTNFNISNPCQIEIYKIQTRTLDFFNFEPDFLKIDVEGAGIEVLQGAEQTIMQYKPTIQIEKGYEQLWMSDHNYIRIYEDTSIDENISDNLYVHEDNIIK